MTYLRQCLEELRSGVRRVDLAEGALGEGRPLKASDAVQAEESACTVPDQRMDDGARQGQARARPPRP
jgi:hypothetical protein